MKYLDKNFSYNNIDIYNLLKENSLVFEINEDEWDDYQRLSRNIQFYHYITILNLIYSINL